MSQTGAFSRLNLKLDMANSMKWDGNTLHGPFSLWVEPALMRSPLGPHEAGPLSRGEWSVGLADNNKLGHLCIGCDGDEELECDVHLDFTVRRGQFPWAANRARTVRTRITIKAGETDSSYYIKIDAEQMGLHKRSGSRWEMKVTCVDPDGIDKPTLAGYLKDMALTPLPFDVRFSFGRTGHDLWANSAILRANSPYFSDMLDSGFAESETETVNYSGCTTSAPSSSQLDWSDSDHDSPPLGPAKPQQRVHSVTINDHSFTTYHAVWIWMLTRQIKFKPPTPPTPSVPSPSSGTSTSGPAPKRRRPNPTAALLGPPQASPKSIYRLAHLLDIPQLSTQALSVFKRSLTVENVAHQLFSSTAVEYEEVRAAAAEFAVANWKKVEGTMGMVGMMEKVDLGEVDQGGVIMKALAQAALVAK